MNFSKTASYALNILSFMAKDESTSFSAKHMHEKLEIPYSYLRQVLISLSKNGFIKSTKGRGGGYTFSKKAEDIYLADIVEATDGLESFNICILGFRACPFNTKCSMHSVWEKTREDVLKVLEETSLADLANKRN
jgi:Rrf2 family protein